MTKTCNKCNETKELHEFYTKRRKAQYPNSAAGVSSDCRRCFNINRQTYTRKNPDVVRNNGLKRSYGITLEDYNKMLYEQKACCKACGRHQSEFERVLVVDHNHKTGQIRGLLCSPCNVSLGMLEEDVMRMKRLISYIELYSELAANNSNVVSISPKKVG